MTQGLRLRIRDALRLYPWLSPAIFSCAVGFLILALHRRRTGSLLPAGRVAGARVERRDSLLMITATKQANKKA
jgi:hypothetical protein